MKEILSSTPKFWLSLLVQASYLLSPICYCVVVVAVIIFFVTVVIAVDVVIIVFVSIVDSCCGYER